MSTTIIHSELAGAVWKIVSKTGAELEEEDTVLILESMKMEIPVMMPEDGVVVKILVSEGDTVTDKQPLVEIEV